MFGVFIQLFLLKKDLHKKGGRVGMEKEKDQKKSQVSSIAFASYIHAHSSEKITTSFFAYYIK